MVTTGINWVRQIIFTLTTVLLSVLAVDSVQAQVNTGKVSFTTGVDFTNAYFFRGIKQEREGLIIQPYADMNFTVFDTGQSLSNITFTLGTWNSFHAGPSGTLASEKNVSTWYEADFFTGLTLNIDNWEANVTYSSYMSPNGSFGTVQEILLGLTMDDSAFLGVVALSPHASLAIEMKGQADGGNSEGMYLEFGVEPGLDIIDNRASVAFPITLGLSLNNYYENGIDSSIPTHFNDTFGYLDLGATVSMPIPIPKEYGSWELSGGIHLLTLGEYLESLNTNDNFQAIGSFGVSISY